MIKERLIAEAEELRRVAGEFPQGDRRDLLLAKAEDLAAAVTVDGWLRSYELRPPSR